MTNTYYLTVPVAQESRNGLAGWFYVRVSHKVSVRRVTKATVTWRLDWGREFTSKLPHMPVGGWLVTLHHVGVFMGLRRTWLPTSSEVNALRKRAIVRSHPNINNQISEVTYDHIYCIRLVTNTNLDTMLGGNYLEVGNTGDRTGGWLPQS